MGWVTIPKVRDASETFPVVWGMSGYTWRRSGTVNGTH